MNPLVSVIIVNYNTRDFLPKCLNSVFAQEYQKFETIIVDNNSYDDSISFIKDYFKQQSDDHRAILIENKINKGFANANNMGIRESRGKYVVLLNPDTEVSETWLTMLVREAEGHPEAGVIGSKMLLPNGKINSTGILYNKRIGNGRDRGTGEQDIGQYDTEDNKDVVAVCFGSVLIKKDVLDKVGLLDDKMFIFMEDLDFCIRVKLCGFKIRYCPQSTVTHHFEQSAKKAKQTLLKKSALRGRFRIILKNYSLPNMLKWGAYNILLNLLISSMAYLRNKEFYKAYLGYYVIGWNIKNFPLKERKEIQKIRTKKDAVLFDPKYSYKSKW